MTRRDITEAEALTAEEAVRAALKSATEGRDPDVAGQLKVAILARLYAAALVEAFAPDGATHLTAMVDRACTLLRMRVSTALNARTDAAADTAIGRALDGVRLG